MKKNVYLDRFMLRKKFYVKVNSDKELKFFTKKSKLTSCFGYGRRLQMYNGHKFVNLIFERDMQGFNMGNFALQNV